MKIDENYFKQKLELIIRDLRHYTSEELAREFVRLAKTANKKIAINEMNS